MNAALIVRLGVVVAIVVAAAAFFSGPLRNFAVGQWDGFAIARGEAMLAQQKYDAARDWVRGAAERGNSSAQIVMGHTYVAANDETQARAWFEHAWAAGADEGGYQLAQMLADERWTMHDDVRATEMFGQVADRHTGAAAQYGWRLVNGVGATRDVEAGVGYVQSAASAGEPLGLYTLGQLHLEGVGVARDQQLAESYIMQAAQKQHGPAMVWVGDRALERVENNAVESCDFIVAANDILRRANAAADPDARTKAAFIGLASGCEGAGQGGDAQLLSAATPPAQFFAARLIENGHRALLPSFPDDVTALSLYEQSANAGYERAALRIDAIEEAEQLALDSLGRYSIERLRRLRSRGFTGWDVVQTVRAEHMRRRNTIVEATPIGLRVSALGLTSAAWVYDVDRIHCRPIEQGFRCTYKLRNRDVTEHFDQSGFFAWAQQFGRRVRGEGVETVRERTDTFVRAGQGWRSPTFEQSLIAAEEEQRRRDAQTASRCTSQPDNRQIPMYAGGRLEMVPRYGTRSSC